ncbi:hypothetical protein [Rhizosphaericola mali]|uniref:Uncharacterized protein n=1 Tax=Rhizosphaericola mali TaxID=2545455 RepID=A0A5P2GEA8_9BACT|nr:hypothetical protein [Rhizosphaericola mali]QES89941.1 hypothetical protein E0W69_015165 [Rhizosphaericola mali]
MTKKSYGWEVKRMIWPILSIVAFVPMPIHLFPIAMIDQGYRAKVRSWVALGFIFLGVEVGIMALFLRKTQHFDLTLLFASLATFISYLACYLIGNIVLLSQTKSYLKRLELKEELVLDWVTRPSSLIVWKPQIVNSPQEYVSQLLQYRNAIQNRNVQNNIDKIFNCFKAIIEKDEQKAELMTVRHQTVLNMLGQYKSIQTSNLNNVKVANSKLEIEKTLDQAVVAIENEVTNLYDASILEVSAEREVYIQQLKNRNLLK